MAAGASKINDVPLKELHFDPKNPRLPDAVNGAAEGEVFDWLLREETLLELMAAIGEQDYFSGEPLLVVARKGGGWTVVEGNRRLAAVRLLNDPDLAPIRKDSVRQIADDAKHKPKRLPAVVFQDRDDVLLYLGYRHITGVKEWSPLAKARYLRTLLGTSKATPIVCAKLARQIGSKRDYVARLLTGLAIFDRIQLDGPTKANAEDNFSLLTTALSYDAIAAFIGLTNGATDTSATGLEPTEARELLEILFQPLPSGTTRLGESRKLKELASIVRTKRALEQLRKGATIDVAAEYTSHPETVLLKLVSEAKEKLHRANQVTPSVKGKGPEGMRDHLIEIQDLAKNILRWVRGGQED
ncbi:MAG: hypothetical protein KA385_01970 [Vicinamibacteria bacterium]|nr:hypothetical protein [Vicinamibacteria bacterium]